MNRHDIKRRARENNKVELQRWLLFIAKRVYKHTSKYFSLKSSKNKNIEMTLNRDASNQTYLIDPQDVKSISFLYGLAKT